MKMLLAMLALVSTAAFADTAVQCVSWMPCGDYEGTGHWYDVNGKAISAQYQEKIVISPVDAKTVNIKVWIYSGKIGNPWTDSNIVFSDNGRFVLVDADGTEHAAGFCANQVCTISFQPLPVDEKGTKFINAFTDVLRFDNGNLKRFNMVADSADDAKLEFQRSDLRRK